MNLKELSALVDSFNEVRDKRLAKDRESAKLKEQENLMKEQVIAELQEHGIGVVGGKTCQVTLREKSKPIATDWALVNSYIREHDAFDLYQRRLGEKAVKLRWEDGIDIPGVEPYTVYDLSIGKLK